MKKLLMLISASTLAQICYAQLPSTNSSKTPVSFNYYWVETVTPEGALVRLGQLNTIEGQEYFVYGLTNVYLQKNYSGSDHPVAGVRTNDYFYKTDGGMMRCIALVSISEEELEQIATNTAEASMQNAQQQLAYVDALKQSNMIGAAEKSFYYLERDATNGSPASQYALGYKYIIGEYPAETNNTLGLYWIKRAAVKGNKDAKIFLENTN
jgi:TPR repeat protein